jgi:hypothetical protein
MPQSWVSQKGLAWTAMAQTLVLVLWSGAMSLSRAVHDAATAVAAAAVLYVEVYLCDALDGW